MLTNDNRRVDPLELADRLETLLPEKRDGWTPMPTLYYGIDGDSYPGETPTQDLRDAIAVIRSEFG